MTTLVNYFVPGQAPGAAGRVMSSTRFTLHDLGVARSDRGATVSFRVTDSGGRAGIDVPQVYLTDPSAAGVHPAQLAFQPMALSPHRSGTVSLVVPATSFRAFLHGAWTTLPGRHRLSVGPSSSDLVASVSRPAP